jgi:hypothetical protein
VDEDSVILIGHTRYEVAIRLDVSVDVVGSPSAGAERNQA